MDSRHLTSTVAILLLTTLGTVACSKKRLTAVGERLDPTQYCDHDEECPAEEICVFGECIGTDFFDCRGSEAPLVLVDPLDVAFGEVALNNQGEATITVSNAGECNLTIEGVGLADGGTPGFSCSPCDLLSYPKVIPPDRTYEIQTSYAPVIIGEAAAQLLIRTNDSTAGDDGLLAVDLSAAYSGKPVLVLDPPEINFGFVPFTAGVGGESRTESIRVMNHGSGNAVITISFIYLQPGTDFGIPEDLALIAPSEPRLLPPYNENDPTTWIDVPVTYTPTRNSSQTNTLSVNAHNGDPSDAVTVGARVVGSSLGPPQIVVTPTELTFRDIDDSPLRLGRTAYRSVSIQNIGQSELTLDLGLDDPSGDFIYSPTFVAPIPPGGSVVLSVLYNPSAPSDPANPASPERSADAFLRIVSNDTDSVLNTVTLHGWSQQSVADDVVRLEMSYQNGDTSWAQNDFRNVDLELVSPLGYSCKKSRAEYVLVGDTYALADTEDYCQQWTDTGIEGVVDWIAGGVYEEPERIILYGLGQDLADEQDFFVNVHYVEDCSNIPTGLVADLAGIGVSALLGILGGQVGIPITVPPDQISDLIESNCWDHDSSLVTVTIYVNGQEVASPQVRLQDKGDSQQVVRLRREDGAFTVSP